MGGSKEKVLRREEIAINSGCPGRGRECGFRKHGKAGKSKWLWIRLSLAQGRERLPGQTREERNINWRHEISWACPRDSQTRTLVGPIPGLRVSLFLDKNTGGHSLIHDIWAAVVCPELS